MLGEEPFQGFALSYSEFSYVCHTSVYASLGDALWSGMKPWCVGSDYMVWNQDARLVADLVDADSVSVVVTDPPYGIRLGSDEWTRHWDWRNLLTFDPLFWHDVKRVVKPGGVLLAFAAPRMMHRMMCAIEDAGWRILDVIVRQRLPGLMKGRRGDHAVDEALGFPDVRVKTRARGGGLLARAVRREGPYRAQTPQGVMWGDTYERLQPVWEPIIVARRPFAESFGRNLLDWHIGGFHVSQGLPSNLLDGRYAAEHMCVTVRMRQPVEQNKPWLAACSRLGLNPHARLYPECLLDREALSLTRLVGERVVNHPTIKPVPLLRSLIRLTARSNDLILDPFMGTGSTLAAARLEHCRTVGFELEPAYLPLIRRRLVTPVQDSLDFA